MRRISQDLRGAPQRFAKKNWFCAGNFSASSSAAGSLSAQQKLNQNGFHSTNVAANQRALAQSADGSQKNSLHQTEFRAYLRNFTAFWPSSSPLSAQKKKSWLPETNSPAHLRNFGAAAAASPPQSGLQKKKNRFHENASTAYARNLLASSFSGAPGERATWKKKKKNRTNFSLSSDQQTDSTLPPAHKIECRKGKGQHLLKNVHIIEAIVHKAGIRSTDTVLEIGPGTGNLTLRLLEAARKVVAVELDSRMVEELHRRVQQTDYADRLVLLQGDIMRMELPDFDICVANIPYKISSPLTFKLLGRTAKFRAAVLMLQREFARRLTAKPGDQLFGRLSVNTQLLASVDLLMEVGKANFSPPPKVESSVVRISPHPWPPPVNLKEWDSLIRLCFNRKNKTLGAIFRQKHVLSLLSGGPSQSGQDSEEDLEHEIDNGIVFDTRMNTSCDFFPRDDEALGVEIGTNKLEAQVPGLQLEELAHLKKKVLCVLEGGGYEDKRSVKLKQDDFLKLLASFNEAGIHFS